MTKVLSILIAGFAVVLTSTVAVANTIQVNVTCGYLYDAVGTNQMNRLPPSTLCMLVADMGGDGFDSPNGDWVSGDDLIVTVVDVEFPSGTRGFDMASGNTEAGLFSRSLSINLAQFPGRSTPVPVALRWFPGILAGSVDLLNSKPPMGSPYGEFFRTTPLYPSAGGVSWSLPMTVGANLNLDPFATAEFGGVDAAADGMALWRVLVDGKAIDVRLDLTSNRLARLQFRGSPSTHYLVERSENLITWEEQATPSTDAFGACVWVDPTPLLDKAFFRISGPVSGP